MCYSCLKPVPLRCVLCARVKWLPPKHLADWQDHPGKLPNEIEVTCPTCAEARRKKAAAVYWRNVRETERRATKGYGPAPEGVDVFAGFRGGE